MALFLSNDDVAELLSMDECIDVLEELFRQETGGLVTNFPRQRLRFGRAGATFMGGTVLGSNAHLLRTAAVSLLYSTDTGALEAVMEPSTLAWIRTGAATGVAVRHMSKIDASVVGMLGTGRQAITQLEAVCAVRPVTVVRAFSRDAERRSRFAHEMSEQLGVAVEPVASPDEAVRGADIVVAITNAREPVFDGSLLEPGAHVTAAGSNSWMKREVDEQTIARAELIAVDDMEQARSECGELIWAAEQGLFRWRQAVELHEVVSGRVPGRPSDTAITLFESQGVGIEDAAAGAFVLRKAREAGAGVELPF